MKKVYTLLFMFVSLSFAFSQVEGTWKLAPVEGALAVGPTLGDESWWSIPAGDVTVRACLFDDRFVFRADGTFSNYQDGETWLEVWQGASADECGAPVAPHDGSNAATWTYDSAAGTVTIEGVGAHLGLPKANNAGEITNPADAPGSITYLVAVDGDNMTVDLNYTAGFWHYEFVRTEAVSTTEIVENQFSFFPNPATSDIQINFVEQMDELTIRDITGRALIVRTNPALTETVDVSTLPSGLYLLQSRSGNQISVQKLVID